MSKFKMMIVGIGLIGLMSACGDSTAGVDENVDSVSGTNEVSGEVEEVSAESLSFENSTDKEISDEIIYTYYDYAMAVHQDIYTDKVNDSNRQEYIDMTTEFLNFINSIEPRDLSMDNELLQKYLSDFDFSATKYAENNLSYLRDQKGVYKSMAESYYQDVITSMDLITSIVKE